MKKPTKKQLTDSVTHYQTGLNSLLECLTDGVPDDGEVLARVRGLIEDAPSLEPQAKTVTNQTTVPAEEVTADNFAAPVDPSEEPASV